MSTQEDMAGNIQGQNSVSVMSLTAAHLTQRHSGGKKRQKRKQNEGFFLTYFLLLLLACLSLPL